jgi:hypothetical protein
MPAPKLTADEIEAAAAEPIELDEAALFDTLFEMAADEIEAKYAANPIDWPPTGSRSPESGRTGS